MPTDLSPDPSRQPDRRDYFRIDDCIGLEFRRLSTDAVDAPNPFDDKHLDGLRGELNRLDLDVRNQLASLTERDRLLASLVKSINGKVDLLARIMAFEQNPLQPEDWQPVTLSEGGVSFSAPIGAVAPGDALALRMTLPPELYCPQAIASVVQIDPQTEGTGRVRAEFTRISDIDRQHIARHVLRWQIRQRQTEQSS